MSPVLGVALADQDFTFVDPAIGAGASTVDTLAREFDELLLLLGEYRARAGLLRPQFRIGQVFECFLELSDVRDEL